MLQMVPVFSLIQLDQHPAAKVIRVRKDGPQSSVYPVRIMLVPGDGLQFPIHGQVRSA